MLRRKVGNLEVLDESGGQLRVKALEDGSVYLEGWANKSIVDRGKDLIGKKAWNVENYKKNSIMLFNHDHTKPIGKMLSVEPRDEGLYIKGRISNSKDPEISRIRDLVKEGILNSLSVGIMVNDEEQKDGVNMIKSVELHEVSVVAVPMNQDSQFTVSTKSMCGSLLNTMETLTGSAGFSDVAKACHKLHADEAVYESIDAIADKISIECNIDKNKALEFLRMKTEETPKEIKAWLASKGLDNGLDVQSVTIPKDSFASTDERDKWASDSGWKIDQISETDTDYVLEQMPADQFDGELRSVDLGDGVTAMVGTMKPIENPAIVEPEAEVEIPVETAKGLLDDQNPLTQPITGRTASDIEVNPSLDQARQTNVLLANVVMLLQQMIEKMDTIAVSEPTATMEQVAPVVASADQEVMKTMQDWIEKTSERIKKLEL
jgi:HK97 family phage prohead protease